MIRAWFAGVLAALFPPRRFWIVPPPGQPGSIKAQGPRRGLFHWGLTCCAAV